MSHPWHLGHQWSRMSADCDSHEIITGFGEALEISTSLEETCEEGGGRDDVDSRQTHIIMADIGLSL